MNDRAKTIAEKVSENGGKAYFVGGYVRDQLLGRPNKDIDIEVHGIAAKQLFQLLEEIGTPVSFGASFGVYSLAGENIDIALPRKEHAVGRGHKDFEIFVDPFVGTAEAARRRDFTINSMMEDILSGEIIDPFGGQEDLKNRVIRHIDDSSFVEDPLRVFRAAQFAARFDMTVDPKTIELCRNIDVSELSRERVMDELKKALLQAERPSVFFEVLREMDQLSTWFPEVEQLIEIEQDPVFHPEGDVFVHTMEVLDRGASHRAEASNPLAFMLLCLTHDFGKITTTEFTKGRIHAYGHETAGVPIAEEFLKRLTNEHAVTEYVLNMIPLHMKPNMKAYSKSSLKSTNKMFDEAIAPKDLIYFSMADKPVFSGSEAFSGDPDFLFERLKIYDDIMSKPYITGKDLIEAGYEPGEGFSGAMELAHKLRLAGIDKDTALKQVLAQLRKYDKEHN